MYLVKAILIALWFAVIPVLIGMLFTRKNEKEKNSFKVAALWGYVTIFAVFQLLSLPLIFLRVPFRILFYCFSAMMVTAAVISIILNIRRTKEIICFQFSGLKKMPWSMYVAVLLIGIQVVCYAVFRIQDMDDSFYVATATTTLHTNGMFQYNAYTGDLLGKLPSRYVLSPFPIFLAFISECVKMHPAAVAHTIMPIFFVPLSYMVYGIIGKKLFKDNRNEIGLFLILLSVVHIFSYYSVYTQGTFMLVRIWQGKAVLAAILLPGLFYACICVLKETGKWLDWLFLFFIIIACSMVSSMGIMLSPIMVGIFAILYGIINRDLKKLAKTALCCIPCLVLAGMYLLIR